MALDQTENFVRVDVSGGHTNSETTISLESSEASKLPDPSNGEYNVTWYDTNAYVRPDNDPNVEIVRVTSVDTQNDTVTVSRGQENTTATSKNSNNGSYDLFLGPTSKMFGDISSDITTNSNDINTLQSTVVDEILVASGSNTDINAQNDVSWSSTDIIDAPYSFDGTTITIDESGVYRIEANFDFSSNNARSSPNAFIRDSNDSIIGVGGRSGYMRNADGHDASSIHVNGVVTFNAGDTFTIEGFQGSGVGETIAPDRAQLYVEKLNR